MPIIPGLRSPHAKVGRVVTFGRMLDKVRLHARGALPPDYVANLGGARPFQFDGRCCRFLGIQYELVRDRALQGGCDEEILAWAHGRGLPRSDEDCLVWNRFMTKLGWRDDRSGALHERIGEYGLAGAGIETQFELVDADEGRPVGGTRSWEGSPVSVIVVMGVSGCGKTTVGQGLAAALGWEFLEGDALHPAANVEKMAAGVALDDADRAPWLAAVRADIVSRTGRGARVVAACSSLRESYRLVLAPDPAGVRFVHLRGDYELIRARMAGRSGHYMKETLLRSQFEALEPPMGALTLDAAQAPGVLIGQIQGALGIP
jgi:carbohydrate kinase (thermoresistant glucokinase family)